MIRRAALVALATLLPGCFTCGYLVQAANGERQILMGGRKLEKVIDDPGTPPRIAELLKRVPAIKSFALANGLTPTRNYVKYVDLKRPAAVWVVEACAPLAFRDRTWHFPFAGTVPYLGFFHKDAADRYGARLAETEHLDVEVRTAGAFSTLGHFRDPVLSTMIPDGDEALGELADVVLHESTHATVYVSNQSAFNESLASFVGDHLAATWMAANAPEVAPAWKELEDRYEGHVARLHRAWEELDVVYRSPRSDPEKLAEKTRILDSLRAELDWEGTLNNATLSGYKTYDTGGPLFQAAFEACGQSWPKFLTAMKGIKAGSFQRVDQEDLGPVLGPIASGGCS